MKNKKGFTLIELMVVIVVIAIISAVGISSFNQAQIRGRDAKRKQDLRSIAIALEIYKQKNGRYPCAEWQQSSDSVVPWIHDTISSGLVNSICTNSKPALDQNYINSLPKDPLNSGGTSPWVAGNYVYGYRAYECNADGQFYILIAQLENTQDPDRLELSNQKWCDGATLYQHSGFDSPSSFVITSNI